MSAYLIWGLGVSFIGLLLIIIFPRHWRISLLAGIFAAPLGLLDIVFVPQYWDPPHIIGNHFSVEGMLFSFGNGILFWLVAIIPVWSRINYDLNWRDMIFRCLICWSLGAFIVAITWGGAIGIVKFDIMESAFIALIVTGIYIYLRRPDIWLFFITGALGGSLVYLGEMYILSIFFPDFANVWSAKTIAGIKIFGFPIEEYIWALLYSAIWAPAVAFGCNVYVQKIRG